ncbi:cupin domain-containing protein [Actinokineospora soli]|uniref:Cupin domain-containing protein n=1 Tax=Actinokineospora soli TaxID=1048753 RepID=A0ABW2TW57_9PSEU
MTALPGLRAGRDALRRCAAVPPGEFADRVWGRAPLLSPGVSDFSDLLTLADVDELLSRRGLRTPFIRMARDGAVVGSAQFTGGGGVGAEVGDQVRDDKVAALFAAGSTVVLQGLHRMWPPLIDFARDLVADLGHPVQVNAYITPPSSQGFSAHYDVHDVFVLQVAGRKRWSVHEPVHRDPLRSQPWDRRKDAVARRAREEPALEATLSPGDALYLPRGYLHSARALGEVSAHLTVGVHVLTRYAVAEALLALAGESEELRASLPLGVDAADGAQLGVEDTVAALVRALRGVDPDDVARVVRDRVWSGTRPAPLAPLAQAAAAGTADVGTAVEPRAGLRHRTGVDGDRAWLEVPGDRLDLPASTAPALAALLAGRCVVGDLPGLPAEDQVVLVRRLLREGVLRPADPA